MPSRAMPPRARQIPHELTMHGETRVDPYFWLRERDNPDVIAYLEAENAYLKDALRPTEPLQEQLYAELRGRIKEDDATVPVQRDEYFYYARTETGKQYPIFCRKRGGLDAPEEILLDQNALAEGHPFCKLGVYRVSPDHRLLAYSVDTAGSEQFMLRIKDLATGEHLPDTILNTSYSAEWAADSRTLFYVTLDESWRPFKLWRHRLGDDPAGDSPVYHETDESFFVRLSKTTSKAYLLVSLDSTNTSEVRYIPADQPESAPAVIAPRRHGIEYSVEHHGDRWLIVTNEDAINFRLMAAPIGSQSRELWIELIPHRDDVLLEDLTAFRDYLALYERADGYKRIRIATPKGEHLRAVAFPEPVYTVTPGPNENFESRVVRFTYHSLVTPPSVIDYDMAAGRWIERKRDEIPSGYDPALYESRRLYATAPDGARVPISLVYRRDQRREGGNPALLYGYGAYGVSSEPAFQAHRISLLDRGFVFAIAHVRGGSELGRRWYEDGKLLRKKNTFTDFIACAEELIRQGYTTPDRLAIMGGSAGGLLMGAVVNLRPDLFKAVIAKVPFVDVINTMSDPSLPLTVIEYEQWGNPNDRQYYDYMRSYSPYDNLESRAYPHMLVTAGLNDPRVSYWEPAKWVAKLRTVNTGDNLVLLKTNMDAGHAGASGRFDLLREIALDYAFLIHALGVDAT